MKPNKLNQVVASGRIPVGHMIWEFGARGIARVLDNTDLDFVIIDMEHTGFGRESVADLLGWFRGTDIAPFVRVPQRLYHFIAGTLDAGALGIMVANVQDADEAREVVSAAKYAPLGNRGVGLGGAHTDYTAPDPVSYFAESNRNTTIICQIESVKSVENVEAIAATEGVDIVWVGHFDLTQTMGIPGQFQDPRFLSALDRVVAAAKDKGIRAGIQPGSMAQAEQWLAIGFDVISWNTDLGVYSRALKGDLAELRGKIDGL